MHVSEPRKKAIGPAARPSSETAVEDKGLDDEQPERKQRPYADHCVHPPERGAGKPVPQIGRPDHVKPRRAADDERAPRLPHKTALDRLERRPPVCAKIAPSD